MAKTTKERIKEQSEEYGRQLRAEKAEQKAFLGHLVEETLRMQLEYIELLEKENEELKEQLDGKSKDTSEPDDLEP